MSNRICVLINNESIIKNIKIYTLGEIRNRIRRKNWRGENKQDDRINLYIGSMEEDGLANINGYGKIIIYYGGNNIRYFITRGYRIINRKCAIRIYSLEKSCNNIDVITKLERSMILMMRQNIQGASDLLPYKLMRSVLKANELYYAMYHFHNKFFLLYLTKHFVNDRTI